MFRKELIGAALISSALLLRTTAAHAFIPAVPPSSPAQTEEAASPAEEAAPVIEEKSTSTAPPAAPPQHEPPALSTPRLLERRLRPPFQAALELVLRTACKDGTDANVFLQGSLSDDEKVLRDQILLACRHIRASANELDEEGADRSGRARLIFFGSVYGAVAGLQAEIALEMSFSDLRYYVLPPLVGLGLGLGSSLLLTQDGEITNGQTWTIISGFDYGSYLGLMWAAAADTSFPAMMGTSLVTGFTGGVAAIAIAKTLHPSQGDAEIFRSGGLWGSTAGLFTSFLASGQANFFDDVSQSTALGMTLGLCGGALLAREIEISRQRVLLIDTGGLVGSLVGLSAVWLAQGKGIEPRMAGGGGLLGLVGGLAFATWATRNMDAAEQDPLPTVAARTSSHALAARGGPSPTMAGVGLRAPAQDAALSARFFGTGSRALNPGLLAEIPLFAASF